MAITRFAGTPTEAVTPTPTPGGGPAIEVSSTPFTITAAMDGRNIVIAQGLAAELAFDAGLAVGFECRVTSQGGADSFLAPASGETILILGTAEEGPDRRVRFDSGSVGDAIYQKLSDNKWHNLGGSFPALAYESIFDNLTAFDFNGGIAPLTLDSQPSLNITTAAYFSFWITNLDVFAPPVGPGLERVLVSGWDDDNPLNNSYKIDYLDDVASPSGSAVRIQAVSADNPGVVAKDYRWDIMNLINPGGWTHVMFVVQEIAAPIPGDAPEMWVNGGAVIPYATPVDNPMNIWNTNALTLAGLPTCRWGNVNASLSPIPPLNKQCQPRLDEAAIWEAAGVQPVTAANGAYGGGFATDLSLLGPSAPQHWWRMGDTIVSPPPGLIPNGSVIPSQTSTELMSVNYSDGVAEAGVPTS